MAVLRRLIARLRALVARREAERQMTREIGAHLTILQDDFERRGLAPADAERAARTALGGVEQAKERHRDARSFRWLDDLRRDVPYALRGLIRTPGFTLAAVLTLGLGVGATTTVYSVVRTVLLAPLPFPESDRLVQLTFYAPPARPGGGEQRRGLTQAQFLDWRARATSLSHAIARAWDLQVIARTPRGAARFSGVFVSPEWFGLLDVQPVLGRTLRPGDERASVVLLSAAAWRRHFDANPAVVGSTLSVGSRISTRSVDEVWEIVGVMPDDFEDPTGEFEFWAPLAASAAPQTGRPARGVELVGQLAPTATLEIARAEAAALTAALWPGTTGERRRVVVDPLKARVVGAVDTPLRVLLAAVVLVLLIVCANLASLLLARGTTRHREIAVRLAIGASRARIVRQMLAESAVLAILGAALGAGVAAAGVAAIRTLATVDTMGVFRLALGGSLLPRLGEISVDATLLLPTLALAFAASLVFGLVPALRLSRVDHLDVMSARGGSPAPSEGRLRGVLVIAQLTMATTLLVGAGLLAHSFVNLARVDPGYDSTSVLAFQLVVPENYPTPRKAAVVEDILARLRSAPDVQGAGFAYAGALVGVTDTVGHFVPPGRSLAEMRQRTDTPATRSVSYDYLATMGVRLFEGRHLRAGDDAMAPTVALISRSLARQYFGRASAIGATLDWHGPGPVVIPVEIVGVVDDIRHGRVETAPRPHVFLDYRQVLAVQERWQMSQAQQDHLALGFMSFAVRGAGDPALLGPAVRAIVAAADPAAGIDAMAPVAHLLSAAIARPRFYAVMLGGFAALAGLLAAVGLYGVLAYTVVQRTREIGVRMALGAQRGAVLALVMRRGLLLTAIGLTLGVAGALGASRYLASLLFGVTPVDPTTYAAVAASFAAVALVAAYLPARRATAIDPLVALRSD